MFPEMGQICLNSVLFLNFFESCSIILFDFRWQERLKSFLHVTQEEIQKEIQAFVSAEIEQFKLPFTYPVHLSGEMNSFCSAYLPRPILFY